MRRFIDIKSVLIGGLLAVVVVCVMGGVPLVDPDFHGRFTIAPPHTPGGAAYVLDTATGQVWSQQHSGWEEFYAPKFLEPFAADEPNAPVPRRR